ncbi:MAG: 4-cresol dehydrogenase (hydroxylating) flavoprotein subunit [Syntrophorhabdus sp. PtaU1.Bin153]|nr:MAG: 4-cresol dehydrogenase (hydroxylating) flavoprotein subunit [Syntrophorhabdus sp. PtaU1.Bin153]
MGNDELARIVGSNNVFDSPELLEEYSGDMSFVPHIRPSCVVKPGSTAEVQEIVKWANKTSAPLVPVSSGPPHFKGDTVPRVGGTVIVDLRRMKKILRIDARNRVAMVEPGVTFGELLPELEKAGLAPYMPLCPKASKSVLASMLEREPVTMPAHHWDSTDPFLCAEVVFGTGDMMRTGEAAGPESIEAQWNLGKSQMTPFGLSQMDENKLISGAQGTMGIITWATLKCRMASEFSRTLLVPSENIAPLLNLSYQVLRTRQCDHLFILNDLNFASLFASDPDEIRMLRETLPPWALVVGFEGNGDLPEDKVAWQEEDFRDMVAHASNLSLVAALPGTNAEELSRILSMPSDELYWKLKYKGGCSDLFFITTLDKTPDFVSAISGLAQSRRFSPRDIGIYIQPIVQGTSCHLEFDLFYDPANTGEADRVKWLVTEGAANLANMGAFFSRPYGAWSKIAYNRATGTATMQRKLKKIYDPNDVLNPGQLCF